MAGDYELELIPFPVTENDHATNARRHLQHTTRMHGRAYFGLGFGYTNLGTNQARDAMWRPVAGSGGVVARQVGVWLPFDVGLIAIGVNSNVSVISGTAHFGFWAAGAVLSGWDATVDITSGKAGFLTYDPEVNVVSAGTSIQVFASSTALNPTGTDYEAVAYLARM